MSGCIFCKIRDREIPKEFTYEDKDVMVFPDIHPLAPIHLLIVIKRHISELLELNDERLVNKLWKTVQDMIKKSGLENKGYRLAMNGGGAQIIDHLHIHLAGPMGREAKL